MGFMATRKELAASLFSNDEDRWAAVVRGDRGAEGVFYYSVRTTGVYCRPSCAARLARRENVRFYSSCEEAEAAGFRPCKRCRPNEAGLTEQRAAIVAKACRLIETAEEMPNLEALAESAGMSRFHFHRVFKSVTGVTPKAYAAAHRARRMREELPRRSTVTEAIYGAGFNSNGRFYATSSEVLGMTPRNFRAGVRHRAHGLRQADALRDLRVGHSRTGRDLAQRLPDALLEGGAAHIERQIETEGRRFDEADHLGHPLLEAFVPADQRRLGKAVLEFAHQRLGSVAEQDGADALAGGGDEDGAERAFADGEADRGPGSA